MYSLKIINKNGSYHYGTNAAGTIRTSYTFSEVIELATYLNNMSIDGTKYEHELSELIICGCTFFEPNKAHAKTGELNIIGINGGSWAFDLDGTDTIEYFINYVNDYGSLIKNGCNIELDGELIATTEY